MAFEVLATTAGAATVMGVLPRALFALRLGRAEGLRAEAALGLMMLTALLTVYGAWLQQASVFVANLAAVAACAAYLKIAERCRDIQAERDAIHARMEDVRPVRHVRSR